MLDLTTLIQDFNFAFLLKAAIALFLFLFCIGVFIVVINIRSLNKILVIRDGNASTLLQGLVLAYFIAALSLFFLSLVIL